MLGLFENGNFWFELYGDSNFYEDDPPDEDGECFARFIDIAEGDTNHRMILDLTKHLVEKNAGSFSRYICATIRVRIDGVFHFSGRYPMRWCFAGDLLVTDRFISKHLHLEDGFTETDVEHFVMLAKLCRK